MEIHLFTDAAYLPPWHGGPLAVFGAVARCDGRTLEMHGTAPGFVHGRVELAEMWAMWGALRTALAHWPDATGIVINNDSTTAVAFMTAPKTGRNRQSRADPHRIRDAVLRLAGNRDLTVQAVIRTAKGMRQAHGLSRFALKRARPALD